jgi:hypothetical protein
MGCKGLHCDGCGHGGGPAAAVVALVVIVALALRKAWPAIVSALEIAAWTVAAVSGAAIAVTAGVVAVRMARRRRARRAVIYRPGPVIPAVRLVAEHIDPPAQRPAIGRPGQYEAGAWPLRGWWQEIRPRPARDGENRPGAAS